mmetsp:Transcript_46760/g.99238  ORF Transcript_46760/g.99238 Transcript_46760/m.99238 type:complete len:436 (+) Transcript_46760:87-1394(+)|eukprot:CAMPEP_0172546640 /NCGR_PEP_ID=MMETSP1067-20121228/16360_1 /TAXON_ID=265564 ORGANISM="Thalassiosira punctigera, Strain Tpunct2005C2" /NCGR_SAMPLE_ID=MMETSP1067 /ASSEMBLY_ACC=CAM_ASM_000444 /LENGTH=435 /DNA_ID=CAMNT_0013333603 /DNA_START=29 /DNA_END=1336 /DNA_ORIENTATION=+
MGLRKQEGKAPRPTWFAFLTGCLTGSFLSSLSGLPQYASTSRPTDIRDEGACAACGVVRWELDMRRARSHGGITVPLNNGYSAKCIPDATMSQMNAGYTKDKLLRSRMSDGMPHVDENLLSVGQVGAFAAERMRMTDEGRPVWTDEIWNHFRDELEKGNDGGPPGYRNSGRSVSKGVEWALLNGLTSCGVAGDQCRTSVFSAISPWAEAIISSTVRRLSRTNTTITSVDFNPCVLEMNSTEHAVDACLSALDLVRTPHLFDLSVSYSGIEHDGLGRYGDPVNPNGDVSALREIWLLTRPGGVLLLAVPRAEKKDQPKTDIPIWGNGKIQVLQHRNYGAERYFRLLDGWDFVGFVNAGRDVVARRPHETKMSFIHRMLDSSFETHEGQPLLVLRKAKGVSFDDVLNDGSWSKDKTRMLEEEYLSIARNASKSTAPL